MYLQRINVLLFSLAQLYAFSTHALAQAELPHQPQKNQIILNLAESIVKNITHTNYQHENQLLDLKQNIFLTNCSGFANFILLNTFPEVFNNLEVETEWCWSAPPQPRAAAYYKAFIDSTDKSNKSSDHWQRIFNLIEAQPGDFIAYREDTFDGNSNSGHVMIIAGYPSLLPDKSIALEVIDSSRYPHSNDTRLKNGVGKGIMRFQIDTQGQPTAFHWTLKPSKPKYRKIAIGRLK